ncbi:SDR family oxidoreductase [Longispora albida]|uniref:SDR family oxidoreductase n=1 Tax=Longispora albida TaxID=203523 RepID=UPI00035FAEAB|nr:SDR family oxidoreductase [Longispora albida]
MTSAPAVLITGCSTGIGHATAARLAASGRWQVWATARNPETLAGLAEAGAITRRLDTTDEASMTAVAEEIGEVHALVNNAGYGEYGPVEELPADSLRRCFETNVVGPTRLCQLVLPGMRARGEGRIVFVGSIGGMFTMPAAAGYHLTKYALESLADGLRFEVAPFGVHVSLIQPGLVRTEFGDTAVAAMKRNCDMDGPYADLTGGVAALFGAVFRNPELGVSADDVAERIEAALLAGEPPTREVVADDRTLLDLRSSLDDRGFDAVLRQMQQG